MKLDIDIDKEIGLQLPTPGSKTRCLMTLLSVLLITSLIALALYQKDYWKFSHNEQAQEAALTIAKEKEIGVVNAELQHLQQKFNGLKKELIALHRENSIQQSTNKALNRKLLKVEDELTATKKTQLLYKDILAADGLKKGLHIRHFGLRKMEGRTERRYHYTLVLSQAKSGKKIIKGQYVIRLQGKENGKDKSYNHREIVADGIEAERKFSLKYYQSLEGDMVLPEAFKPDKITLWIIPENKKLKTQRRSYQWEPLIGQNLSSL